MTITLLPPSLQNQIAAGEVVERPASVVKELVENSIDAEATHIRIEIEEGGRKKIRIIDNGKGMSEHDARLCFTRYATSKISTVEDLFTLSSFGFRGEALASIASVSQMTVRTKQNTSTKQSTGIEIVYTPNTPSEKMHTIPCSMQTGTEVLVEHLFWNIPARKKFLKSPQTETREIIKIIENFAMSNPTIAFVLKVNGQEKISVTPSTLQERAKNIIGKEITQHFIPLVYSGTTLQISGYTTHYNYHRSNRTRQYIFVNKRMIASDSLISSAITQAYETLLPRGKFPSFVLHITILPDEVDVNVHPRKTQVKFLNTSLVFSAIKQAFSTALENINTVQNSYTPEEEFIPTLSTKQHAIATQFSLPNTRSSHNATHSTHSTKIPNSYTPSFPTIPSSQPSFLHDPSSTESNEEDWIIIGQIRKSFILVEEKNGLRIVDQHAAHERVRLEMLTQQKEEKKIIAQPLLTPCIFSVSTSDKELLLEHAPYLQNIGFQIEEFGKEEIAIHSVPDGSTHIDIEKLFREVLDNCDFFEPEFSSITDSFEKKILSYAACRGAKMFGDFMSHSEMKALIKDWKQCKNPDSCAHGRPVSIFHPYQELEKKCGRC